MSISQRIKQFYTKESRKLKRAVYNTSVHKKSLLKYCIRFGQALNKMKIPLRNLSATIDGQKKKNSK